MGNLPADNWPSLCALAGLLGCRHGFDADHLVAIDGLTRYHNQKNAPLSRWCGSLFSLGHGGVVLVVALTVSALAKTVSWPHWLEGLGIGISAIALMALGTVNLHAVCTIPVHQPVPLQGIKGPALAHVVPARSPGFVVLTGALFAVSFDTLSQAALFAALGTPYGGWEHALALGILFMAGMLLVDGLNGLWVFRLLRRTDRWGVHASRWMGWIVSLASFGVAGLSLRNWALA